MALASVFLFCCESMPELYRSGLGTVQCKRSTQEYCEWLGYEKRDPGCFAWTEREKILHEASTFKEIDSFRLLFTCDETSQQENPQCYEHGQNIGSPALFGKGAPECDTVFGKIGQNKLCRRQQCYQATDPILDMDAYWIYFEWFFGVVFTLELILRFIASPNRRYFFRGIYNIFDTAAVIPFCAEVIQYMVQGVRPNYTIVATSYSFFSGLR